jgi:trehalose 6-phosphate synthase
MRLTVRLTLSLILGVTIVSLALAFYQERTQTRGLRQEMDSRARVLAENTEASAARLAASHSYVLLQQILERLREHENLLGAAVYDPEDRPLVVAGNVGAGSVGAGSVGEGNRAALPAKTPHSVDEAVRTGRGNSEFIRADNSLIHIYALPLSSESSDASAAGTLALFQDAAYIDTRESDLWRRSLAGVLVQTLLIVCVTMAILNWSLHRPMRRLAEWLGELRRGAELVDLELPEGAAFQPIRREAARLATSLASARAAAEEEARLRDTSDSLWTPQRLRAFVRHKLGGSRLFAISNREPYQHFHDDNGAIRWDVPASGLVTALESVLRACEGTWIAQGTGDADRETADEAGRLRVPPDHPEYSLRRVFITPAEEAGFYFGVANEGLWPLCHIAHTRPTFDADDWEHYRSVNRRFADALIEEARGEESPIVLVQDYHFALLPAMIKEARPDARVAIFWHIPWPNPEAFAICPWQRDVLDGLLGADLIGFHLQAHCNNFLATVDQALESRIDHERFAVDRHGHKTLVHPFPISIAFADPPAAAEPAFSERIALLKNLGVEASILGIGVDRADYTKGIPERFRGIELFLERCPRYRNRFTFVQVAAPSRTGIPRYQEVMQEIVREAERINQRFQTATWKPIVLLMRHHSHEEILPYYRAADLCMVTSLHDGMNLVAKEFVAARADEQGALILSHFAGASYELTEALVVNPYDTGELADAIRRALEMSPPQKRDRMARMRAQVREYNVYRWAGNLVAELTSVRLDNDQQTKLPARETAATAIAGS